MPKSAQSNWYVNRATIQTVKIRAAADGISASAWVDRELNSILAALPPLPKSEADRAAESLKRYQQIEMF